MPWGLRILINLVFFFDVFSVDKKEKKMGVYSCLDLYFHGSIIWILLDLPRFASESQKKVHFKRCLLVCKSVGRGNFASCFS